MARARTVVPLLVLMFGVVGCSKQSSTSTEPDSISSTSASQVEVATSLMPTTSTPVERVNVFLRWIGSGGGNVSADPPLLSCGPTQDSVSSCTIPSGVTVRLTVDPVDGDEFLGWGAACSAAGSARTCELTIDGDTNIDVTFR